MQLVCVSKNDTIGSFCYWQLLLSTILKIFFGTYILFRLILQFVSECSGKRITGTKMCVQINQTYCENNSRVLVDTHSVVSEVYLNLVMPRC